jgi:hypothetical protein
MIDLTFRCSSRDGWLVIATARGIYNAEGAPNEGYAVDEIGFPVLEDAVLDEKDNIVTPAVVDDWFWVSLRIHSEKATLDKAAQYLGETKDDYKFTSSKLAAFVRDRAEPMPVSFRGKTLRTYQFGTKDNYVQLIDPRDYADVRLREWAGGMEF